MDIISNFKYINSNNLNNENENKNKKLIMLEDASVSLIKIINIFASNSNSDSDSISISNTNNTNNNNDTINIKEYIISELNLTNEYFYMILNGQLISPIIQWSQLHDYEINILKIHYPLFGGNALGDLISSIGDIGKFFLLLVQIIVWFGKAIAWFGQFLYWVIFVLLNPTNLINDFGNTMLIIVNSILLAPIQLISAISRTLFNRFFKPVFGGFWGWDNDLVNATQNDMKSKYFKDQYGKSNGDTCKGYKCYAQSDGKIPFSVIVGTILCPPIGVFMEMGFAGWFHILMALLLTLIYYIPGLLYALLIIYS